MQVLYSRCCLPQSLPQEHMSPSLYVEVYTWTRVSPVSQLYSFPLWGYAVTFLLHSLVTLIRIFVFVFGKG